MNLDRVMAIADAVLYEGYSLYPYRKTALKNRQRWHFGVLYPRAFCEREQANDAWMMQCECLAIGGGETSFQCALRFLQLHADSAADTRNVQSVEFKLADLAEHKTNRFAFPDLDGGIELSAYPLRERIWKLSIRVENQSASLESVRDLALRNSLVSAHLLINLRGGEFVSAIDPGETMQVLAAQCRNIGLWPVLIGDKDIERDKLLAAPIILYDYPMIAAQSPGDHFDCTEIDEMLALRILTLTDDEKTQMRQDERTRGMLERTEQLQNEQLANLHGKMRGTKCALKRGQRVILRPNRRADIFDIALQGKAAIVESIECDLEDNVYVTVSVEDDPGRDLGATGQPGHRFFFRVDEVEPL